MKSPFPSLFQSAAYPVMPSAFLYVAASHGRYRLMTVRTCLFLESVFCFGTKRKKKGSGLLFRVCSVYSQVAIPVIDERIENNTCFLVP